MNTYYCPTNEYMISWMYNGIEVQPHGKKGMYIISKIDKEGYHFASTCGEDDFIEPFVGMMFYDYIDAMEDI